MHSYTSVSVDPLLMILLGNTSVSAGDDAAAGAAGLSHDEPDSASFVTRTRPNAALAKEALANEYRADATASRWARQRLLYIGNEDGASQLRVLPKCIIATIADAMNPRSLAAAPSSSSSHVNSR